MPRPTTQDHRPDGGWRGGGGLGQSELGRDAAAPPVWANADDEEEAVALQLAREGQPPTKSSSSSLCGVWSTGPRGRGTWEGLANANGCVGLPNRARPRARLFLLAL